MSFQVTIVLLEQARTSSRVRVERMARRRVTTKCRNANPARLVCIVGWNIWRVSQQNVHQVTGVRMVWTGRGQLEEISQSWRCITLHALITMEGKLDLVEFVRLECTALKVCGTLC